MEHRPLGRVRCRAYSAYAARAGSLEVCLCWRGPQSLANPVDPADHARPADPGSPAGPASSADPPSPADPCSPADPASPADPRSLASLVVRPPPLGRSPCLEQAGILVRSGRSHQNASFLKYAPWQMKRESSDRSGEIGPISPELSVDSCRLATVFVCGKREFWWDRPDLTKTPGCRKH